ncbi:hypothetical protein BH09MYX1_BH09MYX1_48600 [soil metagenome]
MSYGPAARDTDGMTQRHRLILGLLVLALLTGCSKREASPQSAKPVSGSIAASGSKSPTVSRDLAFTFDLAVTVDVVDDAVASLRREVETEGGYLAAADLSGDGDDRSSSLEAHIPKDQLAAFRPMAHGLGDVTSDVESVEDVTEARADVKARLHSARIEEARLLELMQDRTGKLSEVLEAEKELARVRENIERIEAEERTMDGRVAFATVRVHLRAHSTPAWHAPGRSIAAAAKAGVHGAATLAVWTGMAIAATGPTLVPIALFVYLVVVVVRRRGKKSAASA